MSDSCVTTCSTQNSNSCNTKSTTNLISGEKMIAFFGKLEINVLKELLPNLRPGMKK